MKKRILRISAYLLASLAIIFAVSFAQAGDSTSFNPTAVTVKVESIGGVPIGGVIPWFSATVPKGYLKCNGQSFSESTYPKLKVALNTTKVPDLRGVFLRGVDDGRGIESGRTLNSYEGASENMRLVRQTQDITLYSRHGSPVTPARAKYPVYSTVYIGENGGWSNWGVTSAATKVAYKSGSGTPGTGNMVKLDYTYGVRFKVDGIDAGGPANVSTMYIIRAK